MAPCIIGRASTMPFARNQWFPCPPPQGAPLLTKRDWADTQRDGKKIICRDMEAPCPFMIETLTPDYTDTVPFKRKRVLLIDDHVVVRKGLAMLINEEFDMQVCGEAEDERSGRDAAACFRCRT